MIAKNSCITIQDPNNVFNGFSDPNIVNQPKTGNLGNSL